MESYTTLLKEIWNQDERWMLWRDEGVFYMSNGGLSVDSTNLETLIRRVWFYYFSENDMWRQAIDNAQDNIRENVKKSIEQSLVEHKDIWEELAKK